MKLPHGAIAVRSNRRRNDKQRLTSRLSCKRVSSAPVSKEREP
jgi:hypothetical protein